MRRLFWIIPIVFWVAAAANYQCLAEEKKESKSVGENIGSTTRKITDDSKAAYQETKEAIRKMSDDVVHEAKKAYQETKDAGSKMVEDVKSGFNQTSPSANEDDKDKARK